MHLRQCLFHHSFVYNVYSPRNKLIVYCKCTAVHSGLRPTVETKNDFNDVFVKLTVKRTPIYLWLGQVIFLSSFIAIICLWDSMIRLTTTAYYSDINPVVIWMMYDNNFKYKSLRGINQLSLQNIVIVQNCTAFSSIITSSWYKTIGHFTNFLHLFNGILYIYLCL